MCRYLTGQWVKTQVHHFLEMDFFFFWVSPFQALSFKIALKCLFAVIVVCLIVLAQPPPGPSSSDKMRGINGQLLLKPKKFHFQKQTLQMFNIPRIVESAPGEPLLPLHSQMSIIMPSSVGQLIYFPLPYANSIRDSKTDKFISLISR